MDLNALAKDLAGLKKELRDVSNKLSEGYKELEAINRTRELARADLKNIQTLKDPLLQNYEIRIKKKKDELVLIEADIKAAQITRQDIDEAMAERLENGQHAIANSQKVEWGIQKSVEHLRRVESSINQDISNMKAEQDRQRLALASVSELVASLAREKARLDGWILSKEKLTEMQESLEIKEVQLNSGRDRLDVREKELSSFEHDLNVMGARLMPRYLEVFSRTNSVHINP